jgi:hypothetical protein
MLSHPYVSPLHLQSLRQIHRTIFSARRGAHFAAGLGGGFAMHRAKCSFALDDRGVSNFQCDIRVHLPLA